MTNEEILKKAINKAVENGGFTYYGIDCIGLCKDEEYLLLLLSNGKEMCQYYEWQELIFHHEFAKAFWGDTTYTKKLSNTAYIVTDKDSRGWKYHLQMMVLEEDPIKYLEKFL